MLNRGGFVVHGSWIALAVLLAQAGAAPPLEEQPVRVEYVLLDVVATDKRGEPVTDLALDDFRLTEGGKRIKIESLDVLDLRVSTDGGGGVGATAAAPDGSSPDPRYVLALDLGQAEGTELNKSFDQLGEFLDRAEERPGFTVAILAADAGELTDGLVRAPEAREALARYRARRVGDAGGSAREWARTSGSTPGSPGGQPGPVDDSHGSVSGLSAAGPAADELSVLEERFASCRKLGDGGPGAGVNAHNCIRDELILYLENRNAQTTELLATLESLAYRFGATARPTFILLLSPGLAIRPGEAAVALARSYLPGGAATEGPDFVRSIDLLPQPRSFEPELRRVVHACVRGRVVFHTFDIFTFGAEEFRRADPAFDSAPEEAVRLHGEARAESIAGLAELAQETGGTFHSGKTLKPMTGVLDQTLFLYTLGYSSPEGKPGAYRKIKLKCRRKGIRLLHRGGYFGG
jgi:VWFA-related protein